VHDDVFRSLTQQIMFALTNQVKLTYESGQEVEVDASAYMAELATQVYMYMYICNSM
jgi:hypothetical protein